MSQSTAFTPATPTTTVTATTARLSGRPLSPLGDKRVLPPSEKRPRPPARRARGPRSAEPYAEGQTWSIRPRLAGKRVYLGGFATRQEALDAAAEQRHAHRQGPLAHGHPQQVTVADAMMAMALETLPFMKGGAQDGRRINRYLRAAELDTLSAVPLAPDRLRRTAAHRAPQDGSSRPAPTHYHAVSVTPFTPGRVVPAGLSAHRYERAESTRGSDRLRERLALTPVANVTRLQMQGFINALQQDGLGSASVALERALLRKLFNHARVAWGWPGLSDNPATDIRMPKVDNKRKRVMSATEQQRLDEALHHCRNQLVEPTLTLMRETAMRSSEPLRYASWGDVDWSRSVLQLRDSKSGARDVPLSGAAVDALRRIAALTGDPRPEDKLVTVTYEALKASWQRACIAAQVDDLHLHDLRHTAATRFALRTGNFSLVQVLTGLKTMSQMARYVNVTADDAVAAMNAPAQASTAVTPSGATLGASVVPVDAKVRRAA